MKVHIESHQDHSFWYGTFTEFARANSLTPGQMFDIHEQLEQSGKVTVRGCGATHYTVRRGTRPQPARRTSFRALLGHYAY